jgi:ATP-binding cassette, subfamily C (CFTR/MRP), member 1
LVTPSLTLGVFVIIAHANGYILDTAKMFATISLLTLINQPLAILFPSAPYITSMITCFDRINKFIETDQRSDPRHKLLSIPDGLTSNGNGDTRRPNDQTGIHDVTDRVMDPGKIDITVSNGEFGWNKGSKPVLKDINMSIAKGKFTMIIGPVGCGKTTLLKALLGELPSSRGLVSISSDVLAYCDQTPWIVNATLKENIISLSGPDETFYKSVLHACALEEDLDHFPDGDNSQLGSKGITLSGGQKQRVVSKKHVQGWHLTNFSHRLWPARYTLDITSTYMTTF